MVIFQSSFVCLPEGNMDDSGVPPFMETSILARDAAAHVFFDAMISSFLSYNCPIIWPDAQHNVIQ